MKDYQRR